MLKKYKKTSTYDGFNITNTFDDVLIFYYCYNNLIHGYYYNYITKKKNSKIGYYNMEENYGHWQELGFKFLYYL